jgi:hypothetical protein
MIGYDGRIGLGARKLRGIASIGIMLSLSLPV